MSAYLVEPVVRVATAIEKLADAVAGRTSPANQLWHCNWMLVREAISQAVAGVMDADPAVGTREELILETIRTWEP